MNRRRKPLDILADAEVEQYLLSRRVFNQERVRRAVEEVMACNRLWHEDPDWYSAADGGVDDAHPHCLL